VAAPARELLAVPTPTKGVTLRADVVAARLGLGAFNAVDRAALEALSKGESVWVSDPDSARARARFFVAAASNKRPALLIAPSPATLAREQALLQRAEVPVALLSLVGDRVAPAELAKLAKPGPLVILAASDALSAPDVERALQQANIQRVAVDSAHLLSAQGHELRPSFAAVRGLLARIGKPALHLLSSCARGELRRSIGQQFGIPAGAQVEVPLLAEGVALDALPVRAERRNGALLGALRELAGPGVVLCATPHDTDAAFAAVDAAGIPAFRVHAGMPKPDREAALSRFAASANGVLLTTSAHAPDSGLPHLGERPEDEPKIGFGQSAPRADLRFVVHHQAPASLEQYACEVTWVGRDGQGGVALMLFDSAQLSLNDAILEQQRLREKQVLALLRALETFQRNGQVPQAKPLTVEWLALNSGLSRRTSERLVLLLADSGVLRRTPEGVRTVADGKVLSQAAEALARDLERLREGDRARLAAVERLADSSECRRRVFLRYFAGESGAPCGICSTCQRGKPRGRVAAEQVAPGLR
jgi:ATP-dependent DNA helicase RecQ